MRIRKRKGPVASASSSTQPQPDETTSLVLENEQRMHHCPLPEAQEEEPAGHERMKVGSDIQKGCSHSSRGKWRKALLDMNASHVGIEVKRKGEDTDVECRWRGNIRRHGGNLWFASKEANSDEPAPKEAISSISEEGNSVDSSRSRGNSQSQHCVDVDGKYCIPPKKQKSSSSLDSECHHITAGLDTVHLDVQKVNNPKVGSNTVTSASDRNFTQLDSRCRRMNGRGWRCSQPTLVGYALCEHHLGKAKLKSINNANVFRGDRGVPPNKAENLHLMLSEPDDAFVPPHRQQQQKKRLVKSRSLSQMNL